MTDESLPKIEHQEKKRTSGSAGLTEDAAHFIYEALGHQDAARAKAHLQRLHPADIAELLDQSTSEQRKDIITILSKDLDPDVLVELDPEVKDEVMDYLGADISAEVIAELDVDDALHVIEDLDKEEQQEILQKISDVEVRADLEEGLSYPENSAGRLMHNVVVSVPSSWTVGQTVDHLRSEEELPDDFHEIYVVDKENRPVGGISVSRVLRTHRNVSVRDIMRKDLRLIAPYMDQEEVAYLFHKYGLVSAPVADEGLKLVGVITADDIVDVIQEEAAEDMLRLGGVSGSGDLFVSFTETVKRRIPWLFVNMLTASMAASVVSMFTETISQLVTLAILMPIVASLGGNAGTQALTVIVRAIAMKELKDGNTGRIIRKEVSVALANGILLALFGYAASYGLFRDAHVSAVFSMAITGNFLMAGTAGALIPITLEKVGIDPAIASGIFLTAMTDMTGFFTFLGLATLMLT